MCVICVCVVYIYICMLFLGDYRRNPHVPAKQDLTPSSSVCLGSSTSIVYPLNICQPTLTYKPARLYDIFGYTSYSVCLR